ncbi:TATA-binding protein-associated factor [Wickerhamomyces ciferrii]|uniref:TATA-binding protein-associated factor mot1 n=1 Tax=Wickerhamomyces ciferrii (strain ATCC 14091 / BCRC 22168 / CBS 111 / JCM 3599 / NBRC 0793 / NRRL Y-1031 F-60-10) TaxID=1206466 RepID=K0KTK8_WICCF|nr:TATA-binding protein-associated factor [Wickerhamomyces ciferrii]CCH44714.1 TATA-binding protein-associated factor [Wickerhamomyces ciferrii]
MSRLERLVVLLDTGSTQFIRNTAADQLSDLAKAHPEEVLNLLSRVYPFLNSKKWETRTTAARALGGIVGHSPLWDPNEDEEGDIKLEELDDAKIKLEESELKLINSNQSFISFDNWNVQELLKSDKKFLSSSTVDDFSKNTNSIDSLKKQKVSTSNKLGIKTEFDEDLENESTPEVKQEVKQEIKQEIPKESTPNPPPLQSNISSARLKAMAKRKAKMESKGGGSAKAKPVDLSQSSVSKELVKEDSIDQKIQNSNGNASSKIDVTSQAGGNKLVVENKAPEIPPVLAEHAKVAGLVWPFQGVYELLVVDLFSETWEIRHGAVLGLRELIKKHGRGAGRVKGRSLKENDAKNRQTLEDLSCRLLTIFALDRFGDFVYDTVVAPVRESAAQTLAALLIHLDEDLVLKIFKNLDHLVLQDAAVTNKLPCWEASHGGMLGLRYFVSVRTDILSARPELLDDVVKMVLHGLKESDDDVQAVAAATLTPITDEFVKLRQETVKTIISTIWDSLTRLSDDLSASIGAVMDLLSKLCIHPEVMALIGAEALENEEHSLKNLIPRLYPFLRHSITNVRKSVLKTLLAFLSIDDTESKNWIDCKAFRLIYQNLLLEQNEQVLKLSQEVFLKLLQESANVKDFVIDETLANHLQPIINLTMTPIGVSRYNYSMNTTYLMKPSGAAFEQQLSHTNAIHDFGDDSSDGTASNGRRGKKRKTPPTKPEPSIPVPENDRINIDGPLIIGDITLLGIEVFIRTRLAAATALGQTLSYLSEDSLKVTLQLLKKYLNVPHSTPRLLTSIAIKEYCTSLINRNLKPSAVAIDIFYDDIVEVLNDPSKLPSYRELVPTLKAVRTQCHSLFRVFVEQGKLSSSKVPELPVVVHGENEAGPGAFSLELADSVVNEQYEKLLKAVTPVYRMSAQKALEDAKSRVLMATQEAKDAKHKRTISILSNYASAAILLGDLPKKLNHFIRSLMDSVKGEDLEELQKRSSSSVADLIEKLISNGKSNVSNKIVKNLCGFLCVDTSEVPEFGSNRDVKDIILSLKKEEIVDSSNNSALESRIKRRGAKFALENVLIVFKSEIFEKVTQLKSVIFEPLKALESSSEVEFDDTTGQAAVDALGVLKVLIPTFDKSLHDEILALLPSILNALRSSLSVLRYSAAKALAILAKVIPSKTIPFIVKSVLPLLNNAGSVKERQGGIEAVYHLSSSMDSDILPYVIFLIVPVLGRMSDADKDVRVLATTTFASIIKLVPLEAGIPDPEDVPKELLEGREKEREFIQQMMDPSKSKPFDLPVAIDATLRKYQQEGVNWLAFLNKYHLHGILCDDMGLGKTLQTICIVASDHHLRAEDYKVTKSIETAPLPTLIICPPSLTGHWEQEFNQYSPFLKVVVYAGGPSFRSGIRPQLNSCDIIVTSYDVVRNDVEFLSAKDYNYCVLDEGHIIKNAASKLTKSVKRVRSNHRLILSGTPIQNNVLELWSLFDFLMPGFLGSEKLFQERFARPIAASRNSKTSSKEQEAGALALEALHKQVLPFMLRRLKEEVLSDLPPKIIQDYYCQLSDLQKQLYKDFAKKQKTIVENDIQTVEVAEKKTHIFQALQYMRKLCNHPSLVLSESHPQYYEVQKYLRDTRMSIHDIHHAPKLMALRTLLLECGIGTADVEKSNSAQNTGNVISQHRALVFCQLKDMLDMVENDLLKKYLPSVSFMRLDGSTDPRDRQGIVRKFNEDPSIDVLLLTTKVGGLGLNLTGADTVIFVEHDWNPMNDLQAMDRAHRLGQKKVVNVYRLITKDTLEEKIMGLQKFKMNIASTIVSQQNAGLSSMDTNQLLDLFDVEQHGQQEEHVSELEDIEKKKNGGTNGQDIVTESGLTGKAGAAIGELGELWDQSQYEEEYNLDTFIKSLK